ncbi:uncharacterized protein LOC132729023 [Ruditapes philippinarum]|uniref:uncharacterized protein LOC132729023 n=1 Tax=Ruditapes philippinarum TaxID=129788 RepID=UPI00295AA64F|nr:uncharacterized protein LOC132729023 [Ruditapes philippinarum]
MLENQATDNPENMLETMTTDNLKNMMEAYTKDTHMRKMAVQPSSLKSIQAAAEELIKQTNDLQDYCVKGRKKHLAVVPPLIHDSEGESEEYIEDSDNDSDYIPSEDGSESNTSEVISEIEIPEVSLTSVQENRDQNSDHEEPPEMVEPDTEEPTKHHLRWLFRNIRIETYEAKDGKRNYSRTAYCLYCKNKYISKMSSHLLSVHTDETLVKQIRDLPLRSIARKMELQKLQKEGNYQHNAEVLKKGEGLIVVCRRPGKLQGDASNYVPCEYCFGYYHEKQIWNHCKGCYHRAVVVDSSANYLRNGRAMLSPFFKREDKDYDQLNELISKMKETEKHPGLKKVCYEDELIREFGIHLLDKLGSEEEQRRKDKDNIRTKMRCVASLLNKLNTKKLLPQPLNNFISAQEFINVVNAVKELSRERNSPQFAVCVGGYLKHICLLKKSLGRRQEDRRKREEAQAFDEEFAAHWNSKVSAVANRTKRLRSLNKKQDIPATEDLVKLKDYLIMRIKQGASNLRPTYAEYVEMTQVVTARVALFNMRRIAEVEELKIADFDMRISGNEAGSNREILESLDVTEKALLQRIQLIEVRGKSTRGVRKVFILLTPDMVKGIEYLLQTRAYAGVKSDNKYVFGRTCATPQDGCTAMREVAKACPGLSNPNLIRTRLLRRYLATSTQIMDMSGDELRMVADHMGHSVQIHTDIYKLQSSVLERTKVARALVAIENGTLCNFRGHSLSSINIDEIPDPVDPIETMEDKETDDFNEGVEDMDVAGGVSSEAIVVERKGLKRKRWSSEEERDLERAFGVKMKNKQNVSTEDIKWAKENFQSLMERSEAVIRSKVNNIILGKSKRN